MYSILSGPFVWVVFIVFVVGMACKLYGMLRLAKKDKVVYSLYERPA